MTTTNVPDPGLHLSTLRLHQLRLGELDAVAARAARAHVDRCERCRARLRHQDQVRAEFVLRPAPEILREPARRRWTAVRWAMPLVAAMAALGLVAVRGVDSDGLRTRGTAPTMEVWLATEGGPRPLLDDDRLGEGDRVAIKYDARGASHVGFAGRDRTGLVEVYGIFPVPGEGLVNAPFGLELDDVPGDQELFVVTGDGDLDVERVKKAVLGDVSGGNGDVRVQRAVVTKRE